MGNLKWLLIGVLVLLGLYWVVQFQQSGYTTQTGAVFPDDQDRIFKVEMQKEGQALTLEKKDGDWTIVGHDTLQVKADRIKSLFDEALKVVHETVMTQKAENWGKYSVEDATGTHVKVYDASGKLLTHAVFGQSTSDWARNYVRIGDGPEVYLTDRSIMYQVHTSPNYWGEKPPEAPLDSTQVTPIAGTEKDQ